jgi:hypothetical protein
MNVQMPESLARWARAALADRSAGGDLRIVPLAAEASTRAFYRVRDGADSWVIMASPPASENNTNYQCIAAAFARAGLGVPEILASDEAEGWYLLTDVGETPLEAVYATPDKDAAIAAAINALVILQRVDDNAIARYTTIRFADELDIFRDWFVDRLLGCALPADLNASFTLLVERTADQQQCCVHRDFHCRNLLFGPGSRLGIVDFQDALIGPVSYDLASLLHDCYFTFTPSQIDHWCARYLAASGFSLEAGKFREDLDHCAVQRQLKAVGIFARLALRDGKTSHLRYIEPVLGRLAELCGGYRELADLGGWLNALVPAARKELATWQL